MDLIVREMKKRKYYDILGPIDCFPILSYTDDINIIQINAFSWLLQQCIYTDRINRNCIYTIYA